MLRNMLRRLLLVLGAPLKGAERPQQSVMGTYRNTAT